MPVRSSDVSLTNPPINVGSDPESMFALRFKFSSLGKLVAVNGRLPFRTFRAIMTDRNDVLSMNCAGMDPVKALSLTSTSSRFGIVPKKTGKGPLKKLRFTMKLRKLAMDPNSVGSGPVNPFMTIANSVRFEICASCVGSVPKSWLSLKSRVSVDVEEVGLAQQ